MRNYVLRGLHYQESPFEKSKLSQVIKSGIQDIMTDIRPESKTLGKYLSAFLTEENKHQLFISKGFAYGFLALREQTTVVCKVNSYYAPEYEKSIIWNDKDLGIHWHTDHPSIVSKKDNRGQKFNTIKSMLKN